MNETFLLIGASSDLALEFLEELFSKDSQSKYKIYATYYSDSTQLEAIKNSHLYNFFEIVKCDLSDYNDLNNLRSIIESNDDYPDYIIHFAAAKFEYMRIRDFDWEKVKHDLDIQVGSLDYICKWFLPEMKKKHYGRVIAIATEYTLGVPPKFLSNYIVSKYALVGIVKALASEYSGSGITFNAISPGMMETKFLDNIDERTAEINAKNSAMKRNISLKEVTGAVFYLLSDSASYVNGINMNLSGGNYM